MGPEKRKFYGNVISSTGVSRPQYNLIDKWTVPGPEYFDLLIRKTRNQIIWGANYYNYQFGPGMIVWDKVNGDSSFSDCELAYCSAHDSVRLFRFMWNGMCQGKSITEGHIMQGNKRLNEKRIHQNQKPIPLYGWMYKKYALPGQKIFDGHVGSGSNRIVAHDYGCDFYGSELDPAVFEDQELRFKQHISQHKLL